MALALHAISCFLFSPFLVLFSKINLLFLSENTSQYINLSLLISTYNFGCPKILQLDKSGIKFWQVEFCLSKTNLLAFEKISFIEKIFQKNRVFFVTWKSFYLVRWRNVIWRAFVAAVKLLWKGSNRTLDSRRRSWEAISTNCSIKNSLLRVVEIHRIGNDPESKISLKIHWKLNFKISQN